MAAEQLGCLSDARSRLSRLGNFCALHRGEMVPSVYLARGMSAGDVTR
jgi:hypothetical protein